MNCTAHQKHREHFPEAQPSWSRMDTFVIKGEIHQWISTKCYSRSDRILSQFKMQAQHALARNDAYTHKCIYG